MKKVALIPIDNRPVCYELPKQIIDLSDENEIFLPNINLMGDLTKNADIEGLFNWIDSLKDIDIFVISLDTIAYGGLIPSRRSKVSFEVIKSRIDKLFSILKKNKSKVYAFSSIMRISNNNIKEEEKEYWSLYGTKIFDYSYKFHKMEQNYTEGNEKDYNSARLCIPKDILEDYLNTRKRNFEINKYYINLKKEGLIDTLVFSKDDCSEYGLNVKEANLLKKEIGKEQNIFIKTGADEIPITLLSRAVNYGKNVKIYPKYTNIESIKKISKYEDISVKESVESQIELCGGIVSGENSADIIMLVNNFKYTQGELVMNVYEPLFEGEIDIPEKPYFIVDILNANGSDNNLVKSILEKPDLKNFLGYSAWNTTGNTLGSGISAALTYYNSKTKKENKFKNLQLIRFLDDWAYQANVRGEIRNNSENLVNKIINEKMSRYEKILLKKFEIDNLKIEYSFPWNRFFEIKIIQKD